MYVCMYFGSILYYSNIIFILKKIVMKDIEEDDDRIPSKAATSRPRAQQFPTNKYYKGDDTTATPSAPGPGRRK